MDSNNPCEYVVVFVLFTHIVDIRTFSFQVSNLIRFSDNYYERNLCRSGFFPPIRNYS